jgi:hypothetical protein
MTQPVIPQAFITWALIIVSILLVSGITYTYTNRNKTVTSIFTFLAILTVGLIKLIGVVDIKLNSYFLGGYNENNVAQVISSPGWNLLLDAWHIWIIPVAIVLAFAVAIIISIISFKLSSSPKIEVLASPSKPQGQTSADRLNTFMAIDAAKKASQDTHEKLAEALLRNASYEIQLSDLGLKIRELERSLSLAKKALTEEVETLELELNAKTKENEYIIEQLSERSRELSRAQEMFEKLMALHKQEK